MNYYREAMYYFNKWQETRHRSDLTKANEMYAEYVNRGGRRRIFGLMHYPRHRYDVKGRMLQD